MYVCTFNYIMYVAFGDDVSDVTGRQNSLRDYGIECKCSRCQEESTAAPPPNE